MAFLKHYLARYQKKILLGQFFKLVEAILELFIPIMMATLIDQGVAAFHVGLIWHQAGKMALLVVIGVCCALICQVLATQASVRFGAELRHDVFEHINTLSPGDLDTMGTASLLTRMTGDINTLQDGLAMLIRLVVRAPFLMIGSVIMAILLDLNLAVVFIVTTPLISLIMYLILKTVAPRYYLLQKSLDAITRFVRESLGGMRVIRAFSREKQQKKRFRNVSGLYTDDALRVGRLSALLSPLTEVVMNLGIIGVLLLGGRRVQSGAVSVGIVVAFINYLSQILLQTAVVANLVTLYTRAYASACRVGELLAMYPSVKDARWTDERLSASNMALELREVSFTYPDGKKAIDHISLSLPQGKTLGIIGGTGSGKTSLALLMTRFYDPTEGCILSEGHPFESIPLSMLRKKIVIVSQKPEFLSGTIRENLSLGDPLASDRMIKQALYIAQAAFVYEFPQGLDYRIEENGKNLSGGQRQRLSIARALLKKPDVLILDDSFSALDFRTEARLATAIAANREDMTVVLISQRISSLRHADQILVLDEGKAVGHASHQQLLSSCSVYAEIVRSQTDAQEVQ